MRRYLRNIGLSGAILLVLVVAFWPLPKPVDDFSSVALASDGSLLTARIANDEQWRFPLPDSVPGKLETSILLFEDEYFFYHPGVNPVSLARAVYQNSKAGRIVSGASTISMQVARMLYMEERTYFQKLKEILAAFHLELTNSKSEILRMYVTYAPYGGNIVGLEAASWKYFNRQPYQLSWSESALLAVLPNEPARLYPGADVQSLLEKRNKLLEKIHERGHIDAATLELSKAEPIPVQPESISFSNMHLLDKCIKDQGQGRYHTSIDSRWQDLTNQVLDKHHHRLKSNGVQNMAAMVVDLKQNKVLAYVGNIAKPDVEGFQVDVITAKRSSGSLLKPLLYAKAIDKGMITPDYLLPDIPTYFAGFTPKNFNEKYDGMVPAKVSLARSLNIPFVHLLKEYSFEQFQVDLQNLQFSTIQQNTDRYGLSLILGGAEVTLWEISQTYSQLYRGLEGKKPQFLSIIDSKQNEVKSIDWNPPSKISTWHMFDAMTNLVRPGSDQNWEKFESSQEIAWKTGTSFGFRDAWAVGLNGQIMVAVWAGNADGEGRAGLVGSLAAGPALLELLNLSPYEKGWLEALKPVEKQYEICTISGHRATQLCEKKIMKDLPASAEKLGACPYHRMVVLDQQKLHRVNSSCYPLSNSVMDTVFIVPPSSAKYYKLHHPGYTGLPPIFDACMEMNENMEIIYPTISSKIYIPRKSLGKEKVILEASHQAEDATIYWHINEKYMGTTSAPHQLSVDLDKGNYQLTIVDDAGVEVSRKIEVLSE